MSYLRPRAHLAQAARTRRGFAVSAIVFALLALLTTATASPWSARAAPQLPSLSIDDPTIAVVGEGPTEVEFTVTLSSAMEPTATTEPATTTTQPGAALPKTGSSAVPISLLATALIIAGLVAFALGRIISPPLLILVIGAAGAAALVIGDSVAHAQAQPVVTVQFHTEDGTARAPEDYTATSGTISFAPGQATATIVVPINPANIESGDTFVVVLTDPVGATISKAVGTVTITADAPPTSTTTPTMTTVAPSSTTEPTTGTTTTTSSTTSTTTTSTTTSTTSTTTTSSTTSTTSTSTTTSTTSTTTTSSTTSTTTTSTTTSTTSTTTTSSTTSTTSTSTTTSTTSTTTTSTTTSTTLVNQPPVATDDFFSTFRTTASFTGNILTNDFDPDAGDAINGITFVDNNLTPFASFTVTDFVTGAFTYTLNVNHPTITALGPGSFLDHSITYGITDGQASDTGTVTVRIFGVGDPPV
jgi:Calx-beta domain